MQQDTKPALYLQGYKVESQQGIINYSVVGALPNEMPNVEKEQFAWNFVSNMIVNECEKNIRVSYDFKNTAFQKEISFEDELEGTIQWGDSVLSARRHMSYQYDKEKLQMHLDIKLPTGKYGKKRLSWNVFINDSVNTPVKPLSVSVDENNLITVNVKKFKDLKYLANRTKTCENIKIEKAAFGPSYIVGAIRKECPELTSLQINTSEKPSVIPTALTFYLPSKHFSKTSKAFLNSTEARVKFK